MTDPHTKLFDQEGLDLRTVPPSERHPLGLDIFTERGITPPWEPEGHVARARGFLRYEQGDLDSILLAEPRMRGRKAGTASRKYSTYLHKAVKESGGWVMPKHAVLDLPTGPDRLPWGEAPFIQLRPDVEAQMRRPVRHHHGKGILHREGSCVCGANHTKAFIAERQRNDAERDRRGAASDKQEFTDRIGPGLFQPPLKGHALRAHAAGPEHVDGKTGKDKAPDGGKASGWHVHERRAKYLLSPGPTAKRMDMNPYCTDPDADVPRSPAVVCLEGSLKTDAITEAGAWCIGTPSVHTWDGSETMLDPDSPFSHELVEITHRLLVGIPTIVVCDSDWYVNTAVKSATGQVVQLLLDCGADAVAAAPPQGRDLGWHHRVTGERMHKTYGVDDWLGEGHAFGDLIARATFADPAPGLAALEERLRDLWRRPTGGHWAERIESAIKVVRQLGQDALPSGRVEARTKLLVNRTRMPLITVQRRINDLRDLGIIELIEPTETTYTPNGPRQTPPVYRLPADLISPVKTWTVEEWLAGR